VDMTLVNTSTYQYTCWEIVVEK